jgi:hypothetical protein
MNIADMAIKTYVAESTLLRVEKLVADKGEDAVSNYIDIVRVTVNDAVDTSFLSGKEAIAALAEGDEQRLLFMGLKRFTKKDLYNTKEARRRIAAKLIEANEFVY